MWSTTFYRGRTAKPIYMLVTDAPWGAYGVDTMMNGGDSKVADSGGGEWRGSFICRPGSSLVDEQRVDVPSGVELRGHLSCGSDLAGPDGHAKGRFSSLLAGRERPRGGGRGLGSQQRFWWESTISYESQNTNCIPFHQPSQARGAQTSIAIGVCLSQSVPLCGFGQLHLHKPFSRHGGRLGLQTRLPIGNGSAGTIRDLPRQLDLLDRQL